MRRVRDLPPLVQLLIAVAIIAVIVIFGQAIADAVSGWVVDLRH